MREGGRARTQVTWYMEGPFCCPTGVVSRGLKWKQGKGLVSHSS